MNLRWFLLCAAFLAWFGWREPSVAEPPAGQGTQTHSVTGLVLEINLDENRLRVQHEDVPGFMPAMTMPFRVKEKRDLEDVKVGDRVKFRLTVTENESWIDLITQLATGSSLPATNQVESAPPPAKLPHPLMSFPFTNQLGAPVRLDEFRGQALAFTFFFTRCPIPEYCPRLMKNFEEATQKLARMSDVPTNWHFLAVSFDTDFDSPGVLKSFAQLYKHDPKHWSFLTGPKKEITELAKLSGVSFSKSKEGFFFNHDFRTLIIDPHGKLQMSFPIGGNLSDAIVSEIRKALSVTNNMP